MFLTSGKAVLQNCYENYSIHFFFLLCTTFHIVMMKTQAKYFLSEESDLLQGSNFLRMSDGI